MGAKDRRRELGVAVATCFEELVMLAAGLAADLRSGIVGPDIAVNVRMELLDELKQEGVAGRLIEREVELKPDAQKGIEWL